MGSLKIEAKLADIVGKNWMYRTKTYKINDVLLVNGEHIISTDSKTLRIPVAEVEEFLKDLLPTEETLPSQVTIPGLEAGVFGELTKGLMTSFREIQGSKDERFLEGATKRATAKIKISKAVTDIAKTSLMARKQLSEGGKE